MHTAEDLSNLKIWRFGDLEIWRFRQVKRIFLLLIFIYELRDPMVPLRNDNVFEYRAIIHFSSSSLLPKLCPNIEEEKNLFSFMKLKFS